MKNYNNSKILGVTLPGFDRHELIRLQAFVFNELTNSTTIPKVSVTVFDSNAFVESDSLPMVINPSWISNPQPVQTYLANRNSKLTTLTGKDLLKSLNIGAF